MENSAKCRMNSLKTMEYYFKHFIFLHTGSRFNMVCRSRHTLLLLNLKLLFYKLHMISDLFQCAQIKSRFSFYSNQELQMFTPGFLKPFNCRLPFLASGISLPNQVDFMKSTFCNKKWFRLIMKYRSFV